MSDKADDLAGLLKAGRGEQIEWLGEGAAVESIAAVLTAMANSRGGTFVLGIVGANGAVSGVREPDAALDRLLQAALSIDPPLIIPLPRVLKYQDRHLIVAHVPAGMPHVYALDGRFLHRQGVDNAALKPRDLRRLMIDRGEASWETDLVYGATLDDIDWDKVRAYAASLTGITELNLERLLLRRGCVMQIDGRTKPTHAGILLFGKDPQRFVRSADILAVRFSGEDMADQFERVELTGTLPDQLRRAENFLREHLRKVSQLGRSMVRDEQYEYPLEAARELVVNAVAHRDYHLSGDSIRVFIFRNRMEVFSPGGLPGPVTVDNIMHERFSRNPVIVQVLSDMGFIERLGYGVNRVIALMEQRQMREPSFEEMAGGFRVTLYNQVEAPAEPPPAEPEAVLDFKGEYRKLTINPRQEAALQYLHRGNTRITNSDLQALYPEVHPETIRRDLSDLVTKNILRKLGEKRGSYYVLRDDG